VNKERLPTDGILPGEDELQGRTSSRIPISLDPYGPVAEWFRLRSAKPHTRVRFPAGPYHGCQIAEAWSWEGSTVLLLVFSLGLEEKGYLTNKNRPSDIYTNA
jgi:hypothetical protein